MKTPLRIGTKVASAIYDADGVPVCVVDSMKEASRDDEREMARRIVACANTCEGIPTSDLENGAVNMLELSAARANSTMWQGEAVKAQKQRDELLAALGQYEKAFADLFAQCCSNPVFNTWGQQVNMAELNEAHSNAGTVLRKAKGEEL